MNSKDVRLRVDLVVVNSQGDTPTWRRLADVKETHPLLADLPIVEFDLSSADGVPEFRGVHTYVRGWWDSVFVGALVAELASSQVPLVPSADDVVAAFRSLYPEAFVNAQLLQQLYDPQFGESQAYSVAVCTADRPASLRRCLRSMLNLSEQVTEVIVVDNSKINMDDVRLITEEFGYRYVREEVPGLDRARNRALVSATTNLVLFTDDDVEVSKGWDTWLLPGFDDPLVMATTGLVLPASLTSRSQIESEVYCPHSRGPFRVVFDSSGNAGHVGVGASMAVRRDFVLAAGGFPEELDAGTATGTGGDTWVFNEILRAGYRAAYEPRSVVRHWHREDREALQKMVRSNSSGAWALVWRRMHEEGVRSGLGDLWGALSWNGHNLRRFLTRSSGRYSSEIMAAEVRGVLKSWPAFRSARSAADSRPSVLEETLGAIELQAQWLPEIGAPGANSNNDLPTISVVVPTRGRRDLVADLVENILECEGVHQIVVAIDGDIDGTQDALAERFAHSSIVQTVILHPESTLTDHGSGASTARNRGTEAATGDVLVFLDDDVEIRNPMLFKLHAAMHIGHDRVLGLGPALVDERSSTAPERFVFRNWWVGHTTRIEAERSLSWPDVCSGNLSIRRSFFCKLDGFADLPRREDWDLALRAQRQGAEVRGCFSAAVVQREQETELFGQDPYRDGFADSRIAEHTPAYGYQMLELPHMDLLESWGRNARLKLSLYKWAFRKPKLAVRAAKAVQPLYYLLPKARLKRAFRHSWRQVLYFAGRADGLSRDEHVDLFNFDRSLLSGSTALEDLRSGDAVADGAYHSITFRGAELGVFSAFQRGQAHRSEDLPLIIANSFLARASSAVAEESNA